MTLKEYLEDYAEEETKKIGEELILKEMEKVSSDKVKGIALQNLKDIEQGKRDFRF